MRNFRPASRIRPAPMPFETAGGSRGNTLGPLHLAQASGDFARGGHVARGEGNSTLFGGAFCRAVFRLERQSLPRSRHVDKNGLNPGCMLAICHLPAFGGMFPAFGGADHGSSPLADPDACIQDVPPSARSPT